MADEADFTAISKRTEEQQRAFAQAFDLRTFGQQLAASFNNIHTGGQFVQRAFESSTEVVRCAFSQVSVAVRFPDELNEKLQEVAAFVRRAEGAVPEVLQFLVERSWYIGANATPLLAVSIQKLISQGADESLIEEEMTGIYREATSDILAELCQLFPSRAHILTDAFEACASGKHTLSVPAMLAQADGIAHEVVNRFFFLGTPESRDLKIARAQAIGELQKGLIHSLTVEGSLREKGLTHASLNRHAVLHGTSTAYATEASSLRCISLLDYFLLITDTCKKLFV